MFTGFFTLDNTQLLINVLSIMAFVMSAVLSVSKFLSERKNINVIIHDYSQPLGTVQFFIHFQNMASSNISIHSVSIIENSHEYPCELIPKKIREFDSEMLKSTEFPIFLCPDQVVLRIYSNRGQINRSVILGNTSHYLHIRH